MADGDHAEGRLGAAGPLVQDTGRNLPTEFLAAAKAAGIRVIFYHYMMGNSYWARVKPEWVARWPNGSAITTKDFLWRVKATQPPLARHAVSNPMMLSSASRLFRRPVGPP